MLIYQLDELAVFSTAVFTLKVTRIEERHGELLKLISGMLMLTLSVVMLVDPALMNDLGSSLLVFGIALGAAWQSCSSIAPSSPGWPGVALDVWPPHPQMNPQRSP